MVIQPVTSLASRSVESLRLLRTMWLYPGLYSTRSRLLWRYMFCATSVSLRITERRDAYTGRKGKVGRNSECLDVERANYSTLSIELYETLEDDTLRGRWNRGPHQYRHRPLILDDNRRK